MSQATPAFLLTSEWHDDDQGTELTFWWSTPVGPRVSRHRQPSVCFIDSVNAERAHSIATTLAWPVQIKPLQLRSFADQPASACYMPAGYLYRWRDVLAEQGIVCREVDIRPTERYLMERFIYGAAELQQQGEQIRLQPTRYLPQLNCVSIDIETSMPHREKPDRLFSIALFSQHERRVLTCAQPQAGQDDDFILEWCADEVALLRRFLQCIEQHDPDVLSLIHI